jgi:hypothetical protein
MKLNLPETVFSLLLVFAFAAHSESRSFLPVDDPECAVQPRFNVADSCAKDYLALTLERIKNGLRQDILITDPAGSRWQKAFGSQEVRWFSREPSSGMASVLFNLRIGEFHLGGEYDYHQSPTAAIKAAQATLTLASLDNFEFRSADLHHIFGTSFETRPLAPLGGEYPYHAPTDPDGNTVSELKWVSENGVSNRITARFAPNGCVTQLSFQEEITR